MPEYRFPEDAVCEDVKVYAYDFRGGLNQSLIYQCDYLDSDFGALMQNLSGRLLMHIAPKLNSIRINIDQLEFYRPSDAPVNVIHIGVTDFNIDPKKGFVPMHKSYGRIVLPFNIGIDFRGKNDSEKLDGELET